MTRNDQRLELEPISVAHEAVQRSGARAGRPSASGGRRGIILALVGLVALAGWEAAALVLQHVTAPTDKDWRAAAEQLRLARQPTEPVVFAPDWVDPLGRHHLADQLPLELLLLSDVDRFPRVWELSVRDRRHAWLQGLTPAQRFTFGGVTLSRFDKPAEEVLFSFTREVRRAVVERVGEKLTRCPWDGQRFVCDPTQRWNHVGPHLAEVGHRPYRCIYAHPVDGHLMRVTFPKVPLGRTLVGYTGIDDFENRKRAKHPVMLQVRVGDEVVGAVRHLNDWPWRRFSFDTRAHEGKTAAVRFEISTPGAFSRTFCFAAEARR